MDMEDSRPEDQSVILLESDEEQEEQEEPVVIDLADDEDEEDDDSSNEGEVSGKTCPAEVTEEMVPPEGAIVERQHYLRFLRKWSQSSTSHCGRPLNERNHNQPKSTEVDLSESLDEQVKLAANDTDDPDILVTFESHVKTSPPCNLPPKVPTFFSLITWNIDGLEEENLANRIKGVVEVLKKEEPDVVYLQEVIPPTFVYLEKHLPQYKFLAGNDRNYFTATLLKVSRVSYDHHVVLPFHNTVMSRNLLCIQAQIDTVKLSLLNTHLESMREYSAKRKEQMKICFDKMKSSPSSVTTIFGGDLNARDYEVDATKGPIILDLWEVCGGRPASCWTWNMAENTNKQIPSKPKCRFDRLYIKKSSLAHIIPDEFRLIGKEKVPGMPCFPSDHWGIFVRFKVL